VVHLCLRAGDVLLVDIGNLCKSFVSFVLEVECLAIVSQLIVSMSNCLVARYHLDVLLPKESYVSVKTL